MFPIPVLLFLNDSEFDGAVVIKHYHNTDYYISEKAYDGEHDILGYIQQYGVPYDVTEGP